MELHDPRAILRVKDLMSTNIITVNETDSILFVVKMFERARINGAPVINAKGDYICLLTKNDLMDENFITRLMEHDRPTDLIVRDFIKQGPIPTIHEEAPVENAAVLMVERRIHRLLVVNESSKMCGIISSFDIVRAVASRNVGHMPTGSQGRGHQSMDKKAKILKLQEELHRRP